MTDSRDTTETNDDMDPRFENLAGYVLGALDNDKERDQVEALIESDSEAHAEFSELAEAADMLVVLYNLADALGVDLNEMALAKSRDDVERGVR